ncbi:MAG TPA: DUF4126 domain-containing protein [Pyrinomonadaceae bacterium]|jgi:hypothetical protein|nr:DUF4126 domain-containing protein [Pyrinomonadaceae bacterium]
MNIIEILGLGLGAAWTSGINLYATVAALGLLQHYGLVGRLPGGLDALDNWWIIGVALALYVVEFVADKVPYVDTAWDTVHTFIRVPAGAIIALSATADLDPSVRIIALLLGGGLALSTHGTKATLRATANVSPEPFSNIALSLVEDVFAVGGIVLAVLHPLAILAVIFIFLLILAWILPKVVRRLRRMATAARNYLRRQPST